ncbi:hypothetical protein C8035_v011713 [Colletotrichum spinosum]|uniref:Heterokaryon incompatibility domain-containing protein n=1 Tax=Colletotrichum spinosum TaxID=1347390 RepID=A0A4R8Q4A5_9PEZI|nr:hypothetical protein C8035_v011713 [Colletotrichum spinosum]
MLLRENMDVLLAGVPLSTLPRTFQDIIELAASLDIYHVWIDSLCIIQDSKEDWEAEAARMASVYLGAHVTISATAADDCTTGTLFNSMLRYPVHIEPSWTGLGDSLEMQIPFRFVDETSFSRHVLLRTIFNRGWVFQERILSPKVIHCASDQLWWFSMSDAKGFAYNETCMGYNFHVGTLPGLIQSVSPSELYSVTPDLDVSRAGTVWWNLIEDYATRVFTYDSDRLVAFGGIASAYQRLSGLHEQAYLAGFWRHTLSKDLLWTVRQGRRSCPPQCYRAPTWSWASMEPFHCQSHRFSVSPVFAGPESANNRSSGPLATIEDAAVETSSSPFGSAIGGYIVLHCPLVRAELSARLMDVPETYMFRAHATEVHSEFFPGGILKYQANKLSLHRRGDVNRLETMCAETRHPTHLTLDDALPFQCSVGESIVYLAVLEQHWNGNGLEAIGAHALVLEKGLQSGEYRRIGYVLLRRDILYPLSLYGTFGAFESLEQDEYLRVGNNPGYYVFRVV